MRHRFPARGLPGQMVLIWLQDIYGHEPSLIAVR